MFCLQTTRLRHRYPGGEPALIDLDLRVPEGAIYGFLGPNGAGKTTTLRLVLGLLRLQEGAIEIFGQDLRAERLSILRRVGSLIESPSLYDHLTALENLRVAALVLRVSEARQRQVLSLVGLADTGDKKVRQFSLGMKQRLGIALALLGEPRLLILDEPTNGLDPNGIVETRELLRQLNRDEGITVLISSHVLPEIEKLVTHLGIVSRGRLVFQGTLDQLRGQGGGTLIATDDDARSLAAIGADLGPASLDEVGIRLPLLTREATARLVRRLVERGIGVHRVETRDSDLEAIFMNLVSA